MFRRKSEGRGFPKQEEVVLHKVLQQVEKVLRQMQTEGSNLLNIKIKRFQKTHPVNCQCKQCQEADRKNDPRLRGLLEDGFKVYIDKGKE
jgi:hypothetical protein